MNIVSFGKLKEGEAIPSAWVAAGVKEDSNGKGAYIAVCIPVPVYQRFQDFDTSGLFEGWRVPRLGIRARRNNQGHWFCRAHAWMHCLSKEKIASIEELEDGQLKGDRMEKAKKALGRY